MYRSLLLAALVTTASPLVAGSPWISIELPANRMSEDTRGAFLTVRTYYHQTPAQLAMRGTAEGLVDGRRASIPLSYRTPRQTGVTALEQNWEQRGVWLLDIRAFNGNSEISAVVGVGQSGEAAFVRVPLARTGAPRTVSRGEVEAMLASLERGQTPPALAAAGWGPHGTGILLNRALLVGLLVALGYMMQRFVRGLRSARVAVPAR